MCVEGEKERKKGEDIVIKRMNRFKRRERNKKEEAITLIISDQ